MGRYPFLVSVPHGGTCIPDEVKDLLALRSEEISYYSDPATRALYHFQDMVVTYLDSDISRMVVDLNRAPYHLPPRHPDGVIKQRTIHGTSVYRNGAIPDIRLVHRLLMAHYFPYHAEIDQRLDPGKVAFAIDCHSMLPAGLGGQRDAGKPRPLICLGNNGDEEGEARLRGLPTCPGPWIRSLADEFRKEFGSAGIVAINRPFSGGFISNAHFWHKGIPWVQIEVNRSLYEVPGIPGESPDMREDLSVLSDRIWNAISSFWDLLDGREGIGAAIR